MSASPKRPAHDGRPADRRVTVYIYDKEKHRVGTRYNVPLDEGWDIISDDQERKTYNFVMRDDVTSEQIYSDYKQEREERERERRKQRDNLNATPL